MSGAVITGAFVMAGVGAFYLLLQKFVEHGRIFLRVGVVAEIDASLWQVFPQVPGDIARSKALTRCVPKDALKRRPSSRDARDRAVCGHWDDPWALLTR
jgi:hypothetical protein